MTVVLDDFLHSFARDLAARASVAYATPPRALWRHRSIEAESALPYTVLRVTGGLGTLGDPLPRMSVQFVTVGDDVGAALGRAQTVFEALLDDRGQPARMRVIDGRREADDAADGHWTIVSIDPLQRPGVLGPDANRREQAVFNADLGFFKRD